MSLDPPWKLVPMLLNTTPYFSSQGVGISVTHTFLIQLLPTPQWILTCAAASSEIRVFVWESNAK